MFIADVPIVPVDTVPPGSVAAALEAVEHVAVCNAETR